MDITQIVARHRADLLRDGYCLIHGAVCATIIAALDDELASRFARTPFGQGGFYGERTKRFGRLLARSGHADALVRNRVVLALVESILLEWCDCIQLNTTQAIAVHPDAPAQLPHRDQDMWPAAKGEVEYLVNVMWPLTPFTPDNGGTRIWAGSHGDRALAPGSDDALGDGVVTPCIEPGTALVFLGSTLHAAGANRTRAPRRGVVVGYALGWLKPYENQWLAYPPAIAASFPADLAALVGYRQHRPNLGNYEGQCPSVLFDSALDADTPRAAVDALRPDQAALVAAMGKTAPPSADRPQ